MKNQKVEKFIGGIYKLSKKIFDNGVSYASNYQPVKKQGLTKV